MPRLPIPLTDVEKNAAKVPIRPASWREVAREILCRGRVFADVGDAFPMMDAAAVYCHEAEPEVPRWVIAGVRTSRRVHWFLGRWKPVHETA